jgi:glucose/arabinose dehydrogenase
MLRRAPLALLALALVTPAGASAARLDAIGTFDDPVHVTSLPGDPDRLLVVEKSGTIQLSDHGVASLFLDLATPGLVADDDPTAEQGLLSVAPAPDYSSTHRLYAFYTREPDGALEVDEFTADDDSVGLSTRRRVLIVPHSLGEENGGQLQFGPDGMLYVGTGDNAAPGAAQDLDSMLGKILRIDPRPAGSLPYAVPTDNPFAGSPIWSYGLRNPWRFSFDRLTGDLWIGDVGASAREETDFASAPSAGRGMNFGWDCREGTVAGPGACSGSFVDPIFDYDHGGDRCAITGGYVVRDQSLGDLYGRYLYADACGDEIRSMAPGAPASTDRSEGLKVDLPSSFGEDSCGRLYVASLHDNEVSRLEGANPASCAADDPAPPAPRCAGRPATRVAGSGRSIRGTDGDDVIVADGRNNRIRSGAGDDVICAKGGRDKLKGGAGRDKLRGGPGRDRCKGGPGKDRLRSC